MRRPTRKEINVDDSLDARLACEHFLGKDLEAAQKLFEANPRWEEDLAHMGPVAFRYYIHAAIRYLRNDAAPDRHGFALGLLGTLESYAEYDLEELAPVAGDLASMCGYLIDHYDRFAPPSLDVNDLEPILGSLGFHNGWEWIDLRRRLAVMRRIFRELEERSA